MKVLTKNEVLSAYRAVGSWEKTGRIFGIHRGVAYRIATHTDPEYAEKIGNKHMELLPIWEKIDFENVDIYHILEVAINATRESSIEKEDVKDYLLRWLFSRRRCMENIRNTAPMLYVMLCSASRQYQRDSYRRKQCVCYDEATIESTNTDQLAFWRELFSELTDQEIDVIYSVCFLGENTRINEKLKQKIKKILTS